MKIDEKLFFSESFRIQSLKSRLLSA